MTEDYLLRALRSLPPTGETGFEGLVRLLLEAWTKAYFRLARSGSQSGKDASSMPSGINFAAEMKKYEDATALSARELAGELVQAVTTLPDLDLWVLTASKEVGDKEAKTLWDSAEKLGIDVLILDSRKGNVGLLQTFCAKYAETTLDFCTKNGDAVNSAELKRRLYEIQSDQTYSGLVEHLQKFLSESTYGFDQARKQAFDWLNNQLSDRRQSLSGFQQDIGLRDPNRSSPIIRQNINSAMKDWFKESNLKPFFVLLGEEGTGKTWAVFSWLVQNFDGFKGPVVLPITTPLIHAHDNLRSFIAEVLQQRCGKSVASWEKRLKTWLKHRASGGPLFLVYLDGLNEKPDFPWRQLLSLGLDNE